MDPTLAVEPVQLLGGVGSSPSDAPALHSAASIAPHRGVRVRAQRRAFRHSMLRRSAFRASSESSVRPAWIDLKDRRSDWAGELNHRVQIRFGWHACGLRSGRHRGGRHR